MVLVQQDGDGVEPGRPAGPDRASDEVGGDNQTLRVPRGAGPQPSTRPMEPPPGPAGPAGTTGPRRGPGGPPTEPPRPAASYGSEWARPAERPVPPARSWSDVPPTRKAGEDGSGSTGDASWPGVPSGGAPPAPPEGQWSRPDEHGDRYGGPEQPWAQPEQPWALAADSGGQPARPGEQGPPPPGTGITPDGPDGPGGGPAGRRRRRRGLRAAIALIVVLVLLVIGDRFAVGVAEEQMAKQIRTSVVENMECGTPPPTVRDVSIGGFPFLTQILFGKFTDIRATIEDIPTPGPRISWVQARLNGIHVPLGEMISGDVGEVKVDSIRATVRIDYADLNTYLATLPGEIQVNPRDGGERIEISGRVDLPLLGAQEVGGVTTFEVRNNVLTLVPSEVSLRGAINFNIPIPGIPLLQALPIPVGELPLDLTVSEASSGPDGLSLSALAYDVVLPKAEQEPRQCPAGGGVAG